VVGRAGFVRNCPQEVATERNASSREIRKASQSQAFDWPVPREGRSPNGMADEEG